MKIRKNDNIKILKGKDSGKTGKVIRVFPSLNKIIVEGLNLYKKNARPKRQGEKGEIVEIAKPIDVSSVAIVCSNCKQAVRVGLKVEGEKKTRYCKKCKSLI